MQAHTNSCGTKQLEDLLDSAIDVVKFDAGQVEKTNNGFKFSYRRGPEDVVRPERLQEIYAEEGWKSDGFMRASNAKLIIDYEVRNQLEEQVRRVFQDCVDPSTDRIGHAFPTSGEHQSSHARHEGGYSIAVWSSTVRSFTEALVKGAAISGTKALAAKLSSWLEGEPIEYQVVALLNGITVSGSLNPTKGVVVERLPDSVDLLPEYVSEHWGVYADQFLRRTVVHLDHHASPAFFKPAATFDLGPVRGSAAGKLDFDTICTGISLESNAHIETAFYWAYYPSFPGLVAIDTGLSWSLNRQRFVAWPTWMKDQNLETGRTFYPDGTVGPEMCEVRLGQTIGAIADLQANDALRIAISRWMKSMDTNQHLVDSLIDLRIALETLYLREFVSEKTNQEMRFRLALFGAWHLGSGFDDRRAIRKQLREAYDLASAAVHTGYVEIEPENATTLNVGQRLCRKGIQKLLEDGLPNNWGDLVLGSDFG